MKQILYSELTNVFLEREKKNIETLFKFRAYFCIDGEFLDTVKRVKSQAYNYVRCIYPLRLQ